MPNTRPWSSLASTIPVVHWSGCTAAGTLGRVDRQSNAEKSLKKTSSRTHTTSDWGDNMTVAWGIQTTPGWSSFRTGLCLSLSDQSPKIWEETWRWQFTDSTQPIWWHLRGCVRMTGIKSFPQIRLEISHNKLIYYHYIIIRLQVNWPGTTEGPYWKRQKSFHSFILKGKQRCFLPINTRVKTLWSEFMVISAWLLDSIYYLNNLDVYTELSCPKSYLSLLPAKNFGRWNEVLFTGCDVVFTSASFTWLLSARHAQSTAMDQQPIEDATAEMCSNALISLHQ